MRVDDEIERPHRLTRKDWQFALGGASREEGKDEATTSFFWGNAHFEFRLMPMLKVVLNPRISLYSSRIQERIDDNSFENSIWLYEGWAGFEPVEYAEIRAGALSQRYHGTSMLVSGFKTFPGVQERLKGSFEGIEARLIAQQAVPTSHSLNIERASEEKLPGFHSEIVQFEGKQQFGFLDWQVSGGHFKWSNIPSKVAFESGRAGNFVQGTEPANTAMVFEHEGWFAATDICYCADELFGAVFEYEFVHNDRAPSWGADAGLVGLGPKVNWREMELDIRYRPYFIEREATVGAYNKSRFGNNNRTGVNIEGDLHFTRYGFSIIAEYYNARVNDDDTFQRDLVTYYFGLETDYESF